MKQLTIIGAGAITVLCAAAVPQAATPPKVAQDKQVTVIGCAVKGDGDGDGFLLVNTVQRTTVGAIAPSPGGVTVSETTTTALKPSRVLYWLDDDDDAVEKFMGQTVEVSGELEGDVERGEIKAEREDGMIELEIDAAGRKATVKVPDVPSAVGTGATVTDRERELPYLVQKLDVKSARALSPTCQ